MNNRIVVEPFGIVAEIEEDETILQSLQRAGVKIAAYCNGQGICGKCKIRIMEGSYSGYEGIISRPENVSPLTNTEREIFSAEELAKGYRLACATKVYQDVVIELPRESDLGEPVILEEGKERQVSFHPGVQLYRIQLEKPTLNSHEDDFTRVKQKLLEMDSTIDPNLTIGYKALRHLPHALRRGKWEITVYVLYGREIIKVTEQEDGNYYGLAIDIGTTTIAVYLCDMKKGQQVRSMSLMNPQIKYGDDVLTRISHCLNHENGQRELQKVLMEDLNHTIRCLVEKEKIHQDDILETVLVFNTVMEHIALNIPPDFIGISPFTPAITQAMDLKARELGLSMYPDGNIHCLPIEAAFVGADNVAVLIAEEIYKQDKMKLVIDIGTNSEICLGNSQKIFTTSCATGPALEGAQIYCGMRAAEGAISKVQIDPETLEPEYRIIKDAPYPIGICGTGIIDCVAQMAKTGILDPDGKFSKKAISRRIRKDEKGKKEYVLYFGKKENERDIVVKEKDVRAVQLAKAALYAGVKILMKHCRITSVDEVILAGGFGSYIDKKNALELGMYPDCPLDQVSVSGNAAGVGAKLALMNVEKREEARKVAEKVQYIETATDSKYQKMFMQAIAIPHEKDLFFQNFQEKWECQEQDFRYIPEEILKEKENAFLELDKLEQSMRLLRQEEEADSYHHLPLMQNMEAVAYGGIPSVVGGVYAIKQYPYDNVSQLQIHQGDLLKKRPIRTLFSYMERHQGERMLLDIEGPFSILAGLVGTDTLFRNRRKQGKEQKELLRRIALDLAEYVGEAVQRGVSVISIADPEGAMELVGKKYYQEFSGYALLLFLHKVEPYLEKALIHICGKTSYALTRAGMVTRKQYRVEPKAYMDILFELAEEKKIRFVGNACINRKQLEIPMVTKLELGALPE